jgi:hypothetical protein
MLGRCDQAASTPILFATRLADCAGLMGAPSCCPSSSSSVTSVGTSDRGNGEVSRLPGLSPFTPMTV